MGGRKKKFVRTNKEIKLRDLARETENAKLKSAENHGRVSSKKQPMKKLKEDKWERREMDFKVHFSPMKN